MSALLHIQGVGKRFGGLQALDQVSFEVQAGQIVGVMGANGAGKTTLFALIAGNTAPSAGTIRFADRSLAGLRADQICRLGIARTFQIVKPFPMLTVLENLRTGALFGKALAPDMASADKAAWKVLEEVGLAPMALQPAYTLTLSGQKRLEIARAVATGAQLVLLDEVMAGLNPQEITEIIGIIRKIREAGVTILLIEHVMHAVMSLSEHIYVLSYGKIIAQGAPLEIVNNRDVVEAYLGRGAAEQMAMASAENPHA